MFSLPFHSLGSNGEEMKRLFKKFTINSLPLGATNNSRPRCR